jgi:hypothetical protein
MNFVKAPSPTQQLLVSYDGKPFYQGLDVVRGPLMFPPMEYNLNPINGWERKYTLFPYPNENPIMYPTTHSVPGPYLQSYIYLPRQTYPY